MITIPGISVLVVDVIIAETGADMSRFQSAGHLASWAGTCLGSHESAGRITSPKTRPGNPYLKGERGIAAVEHAMLIAIWSMLINGAFYDDLGGQFFAQRTTRQQRPQRFPVQSGAHGDHLGRRPVGALTATEGATFAPRLRDVSPIVRGVAVSQQGLDACRSLAQQYADAVAALRPEHWAAPSRCVGWRVQDLVAHTGSNFHVLVEPPEPPAEPVPGLTAERAQDMLVEER